MLQSRNLLESLGRTIRNVVAEGVGFEPTRPLRVTAFQAVVIGRYTTPPSKFKMA